MHSVLLAAGDTTTGVVALVTLVVGAAFGGLVGYFVRRVEHLREQRLAALGRLFDAFVDAARTGADLLSVHMTTGYPHELVPGRGPSPLGIQQVIELRKAHSDAWAAADAGRNRFELAAFAVELVATTSSAEAIADLRAFLDETLYSGLPWGFVKHGARVPINPVDIVPAALTRARPWVERSARELWGRDVPTSHAQPSPKPSSSSAAAS